MAKTTSSFPVMGLSSALNRRPWFVIVTGTARAAEADVAMVHPRIAAATQRRMVLALIKSIAHLRPRAGASEALSAAMSSIGYVGSDAAVNRFLGSPSP